MVVTTTTGVAALIVSIPQSFQAISFGSNPAERTHAKCEKQHKSKRRNNSTVQEPHPLRKDSELTPRSRRYCLHAYFKTMHRRKNVTTNINQRAGNQNNQKEEDSLTGNAGCCISSRRVTVSRV
jgi:hypothetical protein